MQKLSSFGRGKKFGLKSHLRGSSTQPFNYSSLSFILKDIMRSIQNISKHFLSPGEMDFLLSRQTQACACTHLQLALAVSFYFGHVIY